MKSLQQLNPLETARKIDGFTTQSLSEIAEELLDCSLAVRIRMAVGVAEFVIGALMESGCIEDAEKESEKVGQIEAGILRQICPDGALLPEHVRAVLASEGSDQLRGFRLDVRKSLEVKAA